MDLNFSILPEYYELFDRIRVGVAVDRTTYSASQIRHMFPNRAEIYEYPNKIPDCESVTFSHFLPTIMEEARVRLVAALKYGIYPIHNSNSILTKILIFFFLILLLQVLHSSLPVPNQSQILRQLLMTLQPLKSSSLIPMKDPSSHWKYFTMRAVDCWRKTN